MNAIIFKIKWFIKYRIMLAFTDKKQKSVGLVVNSFNKGGLEQVVLNLYFAYKKRGYKTYILSAFNDAPLAKSLLDLRDIFIFNNSPEQLMEFCYKKKINVLHYHYNTMLMKAAKQLGIKVLYTMHNVYTWFSDEELAAYSARLCAADYVVAVSEYVKQYYLRRTGTAANLSVIPNGIDFTGLSACEENEAVSRKSLGIDKEVKTIAFVASFNPVKHQIGMLGVMEQLVRTHPNTMLLYLGGPDNKDYYEQFEKALAVSSAREHIMHIPNIDNKYIGAFLRDCVDIFTLPTLQEGFPLAVLEALYMQKPTVITDTGCAEYIKAYKSCIVTKPAYTDIATTSRSDMNIIALQKNNSNTKELTDAFAEILDNFARYSAYAQETAKDIVRFDIKNMTDKYIELIEKQ